ncbi:MAG: hypothetical protein A3A86_06990 [Elusimicrobia bacterium RIFCSPLOWO2_01_FULL_60_11]|nr:MAG: hypothetical protein A3A86_06990 [Elusimicrobia bacterium RIFCSPLOWO2_01_FULL_60_11]
MSVYLWSFMAFGATLLGASVLLVRHEWAKSNIWRILAFASGVLLGVSFIHILPEASSLDPHLSGLGVLTAFLLIFIVEGFTMIHSCSEFAEECPIHIVGWTAFGALTLHSLIDGLAIAVAFRSGTAIGEAVTVAILVHKFTDGLTMTGLLTAAHYERNKCLAIVGLLALATPLGVAVFWPFTASVSSSAMGWLFGFIAGIFFYVGASDILPRIHKVRDVYCLGSFAAGLVLGGIRW